jgi:hypothetical protein
MAASFAVRRTGASIVLADPVLKAATAFTVLARAFTWTPDAIVTWIGVLLVLKLMLL